MSELFLFTFKCIYMHALVVHLTLIVVISKDWEDRSVDQCIILQHKIKQVWLKKRTLELESQDPKLNVVLNQPTIFKKISEQWRESDFQHV